MEERDNRDDHLFSFIDNISMVFKYDNAFHSFRHTVHVVFLANHLFEQVQNEGAGQTVSIDNGPWFRFTLVLAALL